MVFDFLFIFFDLFFNFVQNQVNSRIHVFRLFFTVDYQPVTGETYFYDISELLHGENDAGFRRAVKEFVKFCHFIQGSHLR